MKILVTGGAGFIGSHIVDELVKKEHQVVVADRLSTGDKRNLNSKVRFYKIDVGNPRLEDVFKKEKIEAVYHTAAKTNMRESLVDPISDAQDNILALLNVLELCRKYQVKKFVFSSTGGALYGDTKELPASEDLCLAPISPYGISKMAGERYCYFYSHLYDLPVVVLRYSNVYGPRLERKKGGASATMKVTQTLLAGKQPEISGSGKQTRDFVFVKDVARANLNALKRKKKEHLICNISSGKETSINELVKKVAAIINVPAEPKKRPAIKGEVMRSVLSNKKAERELGWKPEYSLQEGLEEMILALK